jgi:hypothetical protein
VSIEGARERDDTRESEVINEVSYIPRIPRHGHRREKVPCNLTFEARGWRWTSETSLSAKRETVGYKHDGDSLTLEVSLRPLQHERVDGMRWGKGEQH